MLNWQCLLKQFFSCVSHLSWCLWSFCSSCVASLTSRSVAPLICLRPWQVWVMELWWQHWPGFHRRRIYFAMYLCVSQQRRFTGKEGSVFKFTSNLCSLYNFSRVLSSFFFIRQSEMRCIIVVVAKARVLSGKCIAETFECKCKYLNTYVNA